jgi:ABC-type transport system substrate-binding protein
MAISLLSFPISSAEIRLPISFIPETLVPTNLKQVDSNRVAALITESLFKVRDKFQLSPIIASSYTWENNQKTINLKIRKSRFSDGSYVTSKQIIHSLKNCIKYAKKSARLNILNILGYKQFINTGKNLKGLREAGTNTIQIELVKKGPLLLDDLSHTGCAIIKPSINGSWDLLKGAIGTGPYMLKSVSNSDIVLKLNPFHEASEIPQNVRFINSQTANKAKEKMDLIFDLRGNENPGPEYISYNISLPMYWQMSLNNEKNIFKNRLVRKAVTLGLNFKKIRKFFNWEESRMQSGLFPFGMRGFKSRKLNSGLNDLNKSKKLLKKAGYTKKNPLTLRLLLSRRGGKLENTQIWSDAFNNPYIKINPILLSHKEVIKEKKKGNYDLIFHGKSPGSIEPHMLLASYLRDSIFNTSRVRDGKCDHYITNAISEFNLKKRWQAYEQAQDCILNGFYVIPLATLNSGKVYINNKWELPGRNPYFLNPYRIYDWRKKRK